jgi:hypothetical protein
MFAVTARIRDCSAGSCEWPGPQARLADSRDVSFLIATTGPDEILLFKSDAMDARREGLGLPRQRTLNIIVFKYETA